MKAIEVNHLKKSIGEREIIKELCVSVNQGEILGILGRNGAGKTSFMKAIVNIISPDEGTIKLFGETVTSETKQALEKVGCLIETPVFYHQLSARENLEIHCLYINESYCQNIDAALASVGLSGKEDEKVSSFSLGMKQRLAIARAVVTEPKLLILDEPINGLDPLGIIDIRNLLITLNKEKQTTIVISSHILSELSQISDRIIIMEEGEMIDSLSREEIENETRSLEQLFIDILQEYHQENRFGDKSIQ